MTGMIRVHAIGGPEDLSRESVEVGAPGPGELRVRHTAIFSNCIGVCRRSAPYAQPLSLIPGVEGACVVEAVGPAVRRCQCGARLAHVLLPGSHAATRIVPADRVSRCRTRCRTKWPRAGWPAE